ncbi:hypothetical protein MFIFM68171_05803 [Madurella fahalii]|uniref:Uncharacterized protein n=1 Tax=Madurella fahalii TaxID=1157608 RepID=A0ABQ0GCW8_9PEZI
MAPAGFLPFLLVLLHTWHVASLPQAATAPPVSSCFPTTTTVYGIPTVVTNFGSFVSSMNSQYSTSGVPFSGTRIPFFTSVLNLSEGKQYTGYGYYDSNALQNIVCNTDHAAVSNWLHLQPTWRSLAL